MSIAVKGGGAGSITRLVMLGAIIGAVLYSKDIQRYLRIRGM